MIWWTLLISASASAASAEVLQSAVAEFNRGAVLPLPGLSAPQLDQLSRGEPVALLMPGASESVWRSVGLIVAPVPMRDLWVSCQDPHFSNIERVTELRLAGSARTDRASWYGHIDLPTPISDRHWVVNVWNNHALAQQSGGRMWEHPWRVDPDGAARIRPYVERGEVGTLTLAQLDGSIYTPVNEGAWVVIALSDDESLLSYHSATDLGGIIPGRLVGQFNMSSMRTLLLRVVARADEVSSHYRGGHAPLFGGDGQLIPVHP